MTTKKFSWCSGWGFKGLGVCVCRALQSFIELGRNVRKAGPAWYCRAVSVRRQGLTEALPEAQRTGPRQLRAA